MWHLLRKQELKVQLDPSKLPYSLLHNHRETPPEQLQPSQHRNIISAACGQNPLAEELNEYSKTCPKTEVEKRKQSEQLASSILTKPRDGDRGRVSPHCAPSPGWPSLSHPFPTTQKHLVPWLATTLAPTPSCSQLSWVVLARKEQGDGFDKLCFQGHTGRTPRAVWRKFLSRGGRPECIRQLPHRGKPVDPRRILSCPGSFTSRSKLGCWGVCELKCVCQFSLLSGSQQSSSRCSKYLLKSNC